MSSESTEQVFAGKYRLIAELGRGGMAEVHLAVASGPAGFNKLVVIKQLRQSLADDPEFLTMFLDEARLAARLNHPNVVHTYEVVAEGAHHFIAMEYLDGQPLHRIVRQLSKEGGLPFHMHLRILADALGGLHYAHELADYDGTLLNVVHRDVTPQNIFVTYDGQTKVVDFGIAKALNSSSETRSGVIKGKIAYMSPEQSRSEHVDRRTDVFAAGVMLWEAGTGQRLWKGLADVTILQRLMTDQTPPSPRTVKPELSEAFEAICMKALSPKRENRHASALELQNDIENLLMDMRIRVTARDVGLHIAEKFAAERAEIRAIIETQLKVKIDEGSRAAKLPMLAQTNSNPSLTIDRTQSSFGARGASGEFDLAASGPQSISPTLATATRTVLSPDELKPKRSPVQIGLAMAAVGALAVGGVLLMRDKPSAAKEPLAAAPSATTAPATAQQMTLEVKTTPPEAQLFLDDERLPGNPYVGLRNRDGSKHVLRAEAPGYVPQTKLLVLDSNLSLDINLEKMAAGDDKKDDKKRDDKTSSRGGGSRGGVAARNEPPKGAEPPKADPPPAAPPGPKKPANVTIDTSNPWK